MSEPAARRTADAPRDDRSGAWPHALGQQPTLRVGDVLAALRTEFPSLSPSKLRFLDAQGLVCPRRTSSGYREYSTAHVERLRYVLRQQRDAYTPLSVIRERLEELDAGRAYEPISLSAVADEGASVSMHEAASASGIDVETIGLLVDEGIISACAPGRVYRSHVALIAAAARYLTSGADLREVRALVRVAMREREAAQRAAAPLRRQDDAVVAQTRVATRVEAAAALFAAAIEREDDAGA